MSSESIVLGTQRSQKHVKSKHHNKGLITAIVMAIVLFIVLGTTSLYHHFNPQLLITTPTKLQSTLPVTQYQYTTDNTNTSITTITQITSSELPPFTLKSNGDDGDDEGGDGDDDDKGDDDCVDISSQDDPCDFITNNTNCEIDGLIPWLHFRYCYLMPSKKWTNPTATLMSSFLMIIALILILTSLGDVADTFFVSALTQVSKELHLSPAVAGISMLSFGNASPDILTSIASVKSGDIGLVMGALSGACVCLSFLVMGSALTVSPPGQSTLPKFQFFRNIIGYTLPVGLFIGLSAPGRLHFSSAVALIGIYTLHLITNIIYLQHQESKLLQYRQQQRRLKFVKQFKNFHTYDDKSQALLAGLDTNDESQAALLFQTKSESNLSHSSSSYQPPMIGAGINSNHHHHNNINNNNNDQLSKQNQKQLQTEHESQLVDLDVINAVDLAEEHDKHHKHSHLHHQHQHDDSNVTKIDDEVNDNDDDDDVDIDDSIYMHGITWPNPEWEKETSQIKLFLLKLLWLTSFPLALLRWLSIPSTQIRPDFLRGMKRIFFHISPFFLSMWLLFGLTDGFQYNKDEQLLWILFPTIGAGITILLGLFYTCIVQPSIIQFDAIRTELRIKESHAQQNESTLTQDELQELAMNHIKYDLDIDDCDAKPITMTIYQVIFSFIAFIASISWLSFFADEIVNVLGSLGLMFGVSSAILGLTVLALGNSLPDLIAGMSLAQKGKIGVSYAAIFGAPVLSSSGGFGLALLIKFIQTGTHEVIKFNVTNQLWLCFIATIVGLVLHTIVFPLTKFTPPRIYGLFLIFSYVAFLTTAVLFEVFWK